MGLFDGPTPSLPASKVDAHAATTPANQTITAVEFNNLVQAVSDIRTALLALLNGSGGGNLPTSVSIPATGGGVKYLFFDTTTNEVKTSDTPV